MDLASTILAVASPPGRSLRGIVRISGPGTPRLLEIAAAAPLEQRIARLRLATRELPAVVLAYRRPRSYTGEDAAEILLPGNPALLERLIDAILRAALDAGIPARRAEPGEFTARAFFNGRLSLTQAEGVAATIAARSDAELRAAAMLRSGRLGSFTREQADRLASALALVEAGIDFTDQDDVVAITPRELRHTLADLRASLGAVLDRAVPMEQLEAIPWVVLCGPPNAGKSTLFNALLGRERAVVAPAAGTTRDVLAEPLTIPAPHGAAEVMLVDLAGLDDVDATDPASIDQQMQLAARGAIDRADLILICVPPGATVEPPRGPVEPPRAPSIVVFTMADLSRPGASSLGAPRPGAPPHGALAVCAPSGRGIAALRQAIADRLADRAVALAADAAALLPRHEAALRAAAADLDQALDRLTTQDDPAPRDPEPRDHALRDSELLAAAMRNALDHLGSLAGDITPDDVLGRVFASFCIGK